MHIIIKITCTLQDVHYMAKDLGEHKLADSAKECAKKAASDFVSGMFAHTILYIIQYHAKYY